MIELSNQECRDLEGSLSDRGCYFDSSGSPLESSIGAVSFSCFDCGRILPTEHIFHVLEETREKKVVRPICACCNLIREEDGADAGS